MALLPTSSVLRLPFVLGACVPATISNNSTSALAPPEHVSGRPVPPTIQLSWEANGDKENHDT